ncbi:hypothetical protein [Chelatococcus asaccharovorans]|uniref:Uncharacterized protein n=1 Tax=Chelatococcus asaccharovorans TaxID=28210 RepID=A0A2V3U299_9HYPH|nr:hypothetical protein [Chelatococcus asaccharovorans]MBS7702387.1 hypothetical protein [Chelatococcus asaccharovorans]PXW56411.1 hypothetical protein C7450_108161 [Chelatococcus asaccharovorans]CAH1670057.1 conserved exported hypothetical protein [Chelatococcus asaccharovorans]CAH1678474.1 conserved exported hypothetical protein [Chelatococcus asaccharovorans]
MLKIIKYTAYIALILCTIGAVIMAQDATAIDAAPQQVAQAQPAAKRPAAKPRPAAAPKAQPAPAEPAEAVKAEAPQPAEGAGGATEEAAAPQAQVPLYTQHALQAGLQNCTPIVNHLGNMAADTDYAVQSVWNRDQPNAHMFWQLMGLSYSGRPGLNKASSILVAAPMSENQCEGVLVQVIPSPRSCEAIGASLGKEGGRALEGLVGVRNIMTVRGERVMLLPSAKSCVIVSVMGAQSQPRSQ